MASIGGTIGGKVGAGESVNQTQFPFFTSPGGVTPQQTALAEYDYGQSLLDELAQFAGSHQAGGPIMSTMATQAAGGANLGKALDLSRMSDADQIAQYGAFRNAENIAQQNNVNSLTESTGALNALTTGANNLTNALGTGSSGQGAAGVAAGLNNPVTT